MSEIDFDSRELCPDDACIGVLDARGVCPECGKSAPRRTPYREAALPSTEAPLAGDGAPDEAASDGGGLDLDARELCPDDACIGLIGPDGRCKECGRSRQS